ncbi:hypothetical protein [Neobacillus fumarioli]|nr:hypothetical protein [Neobacillus fumarioli]
MAMWWVTTIGFVICLGMAGGIFVHFIRQALNTEDAVKIDQINPDEKV